MYPKHRLYELTTITDVLRCLAGEETAFDGAMYQFGPLLPARKGTR